MLSSALGRVLALAAVATAALADAQVTVRVMSFNVRTSYAGDDAKSTCSNWYGVRKDNVVAQIKDVAPDFFGTQETAEEQKSFLDAQLAGMYASIGRYSGSLEGRAGEVNSIHYKIADWKSLGDGMIWLGPNPDAMSAAWNMDYYRTAVWGRFQHLQSGETVCMFNTHYETPGKTEAQTQASNIILTRMASVCQPSDKLQVITGDFNAQPGEPAIVKLMAGGFAEPSKAGTYCGNMIDPGCSSKFDFTFFKLATGACYRTSEVLRTAFSGCYTSDHAPLLGTFCLGGSCCDDTVGSTSEPTPEPSSEAPTSETPEIRTTEGSGSAGSGATGTGVVVDSGSAPGVFRSATDDANMVPGTVDAATEGGVAAGGPAGGPAGGAVDAAGKGETGNDAGVNAAGGSSSDATRVSTSQSTSEAGAGGTVFAVLGVVGMVAAVAAVVARKKRSLDARLDGDKSFSTQAPGYFARGAGQDDLSPLPRISERPSALERATNSPVPTLGAVAATGERDSRSSSVSWKGGASPHESRVNFSDADLNESYDAGHGALTKSARTDFAML